MIASDKFLGTAPSLEELATSPSLTRWRVFEVANKDFILIGLVTGHPSLEDGSVINTSPIVRMDHADNPAWAQSSNRFYRLETQMGTSEARLWDLIEEHVAITWRIGHPAQHEQFEALLGGRVKKVGYLESSVLILVKRGILTEEQARALYLDFCDEIGCDHFSGGIDESQ